jgi:hypothetical protein
MPSKPRTREQRYERCLNDVRDALAAHAEWHERFIGANPKENSDLALCNRLCTRIHRTLKPRPITTQQIHRLLSK